MLEWQSEVWTAAHSTPLSLEYANNSVSILKIVLTVSNVKTFALHNSERDDRPRGHSSYKAEEMSWKFRILTLHTTAN